MEVNYLGPYNVTQVGLGAMDTSKRVNVGNEEVSLTCPQL